MKKKHTAFIVLLYLCIFSNFSKAQNVWQKYYSPPYGSLAYDFSETYDGGYLICGFIRNLDYPFYGYVVKTDINGEKLWQKIIDGKKASMFYSSNKTSDGGFIAGGTYNAKGSREDAYVVKFNACAEPVWCSIMPEEEHNVSSTTDLGIYEAQDGDFFVSRNLTEGTFYSWSIAKLKSNGSLLWMNNYIVDNPDWYFLTQLDWRKTLTSDTCLLANGFVTDTVFYQTGAMCNIPHWYKVDKNGNLLWETKWNLTEAQYKGDTRKTAEDKHGNYYTGGDMYPPLGFSHLYKLSHNGDTIASYPVTDHPAAIVSHIYTTNILNDTSLVVGTGFGTNTLDNWWSLNVVDTLGKVRIGTYTEEKFTFMHCVITNDHKIVVLGHKTTENGTFPYNWFGLYKFNTNLEYDSIYTMPRTYDSLCPHPIVSDTIPMPGNCITVNLPEAPKTGETMQLKVYPNPANDFVTIEIPEFTVANTKTAFGTQQQFKPLTGEVQLSVINLNGQIIKTEVFDASGRNHVIKVTAFAPGMYMLHLTQKGKFVAQGKVLVVK